MNSSHAKPKPALKTYSTIQQLPATYNERTCTDRLCIFLGVGFTAVMLIIAAICYNHQKYLKSNFPSDSDGVLCGQELPQYQYLYFANLPEIVQQSLSKLQDKRVCVSKCPSEGDQKLICSPTDNTGCSIGDSEFAASFYASDPHHTRGGFFCWPTDPSLERAIYDRSNMESRNNFYNSIDTIVYSIYLALGLSIIFWVLVQVIPHKMVFITVAAGLVILFIAAIVVLTYDTYHTTAKVVIGIALLVLLLFSIFSTVKHRNSLYLYAIYLKWSTKFARNRILSILYIPIFILILVLFCALMVFEFTGFWTSGDLEFDPSNSVYHELTGTFPTVMSILLAIQIIWGLTFIKEAFNFCVSGNAVHWFFEERRNSSDDHYQKSVFYPAKLLVMKHFGSVIAGSFMTGFFTFVDMIFDFLRPTQNKQSPSAYDKIFNGACGCCAMIFDFVRSDAMAFINLAGNPYCNSSRYAELLCRKSPTVEFAQTSSRIYRICAHILIMGLVAIISLYMNGKISIYASLIILVETLFISTMFVSYHADAAEAIQIVLLTLEELHAVRDRSSDRSQLRNLLEEGLREDLIKEIEEDREKRAKKGERTSNQSIGES